jgi:hypothetical protein
MTTNPFGTTPPTIPTIANMGNAALIDDPEYPPIPTQQPTAAQMNLHDWCSAAAAMMIPFLRIGVDNSGTAYTVGYFRCLNPNFASGNITITRASEGVLTIDITAGKLPGAVTKPRVFAHWLAAGIVGVADQTGSSITVILYPALSATPIDASFDIDIWGSI